MTFMTFMNNQHQFLSRMLQGVCIYTNKSLGGCWGARYQNAEQKKHAIQLLIEKIQGLQLAAKKGCCHHEY